MKILQVAPLHNNFLLIIILMMTLFFMAAYTTDSISPNNATDLLHRTCSCTTYRELCFQSLAPYALKLIKKPSLLPYLAVNVSLSDAKNVTQYILNLKAQYHDKAHNVTTSALKVCAENLHDAVEEIQNSLKQVRRLMNNSNSVSGQGDEGFYVSNVKTWMSAAMTDEDTCEDVLEYLDEPLRGKVGTGTLRVQRLISNALALLNNYYSKIRP